VRAERRARIVCVFVEITVHWIEAMYVHTCASMLRSKTFRSLQFIDDGTRLIEGGLDLKRSE